MSEAPTNFSPAGEPHCAGLDENGDSIQRTLTSTTDATIKVVHVSNPTPPTIDLNKVIDTLHKKAKDLKELIGTPYGKGRCARFVREALDAGGAHTNFTSTGEKGNNPINAKNYGCVLIRNGFKVQKVNAVDGYNPITGDAAVIQDFEGDTNDAGHIAIYDGKNWVSDFVQPNNKKTKDVDVSFYPSHLYLQHNAKYVIYRKPEWQ
jgi:hypothetical protein